MKNDPSGQASIFNLGRNFTELFSGRLSRSSVVLFLGGIAGGVLGYALHIMMGRMLSEPEYGLLTSMLAVMTLLSVPTAAMTMVIARKVAEYQAHKDGGSIAHLYAGTTRWMLYAGVGFIAIFVAVSPTIQEYLRAPSSLPVFFLGMLVAVSLLLPIGQAVLQGVQKFALLSASHVSAIFLKIIFSAFLIWLGYGVGGAMVGMITSVGIMCVIVYLATRGYFVSDKPPRVKSHYPWRFVVPVTLANVAFVVMTQFDIVLVRHYFGPTESGIYAAASILGKAVLYLPGAIVTVLYPMVAENTALQRASASLLVNAVLLTLLLSGTGVLIYFFLGPEIVRFFYGERYEMAGEILQYFGFAMIPMALVMVAENFLIAKGRILFVYLFVIVAPVEIIAIHYFHESLLQVVGIMIASGSILAILGYAMLWFEYHRHAHLGTG